MEKRKRKSRLVSLIFVFLLLPFLVGCGAGTQSCVRIDGSYGEISGGAEYCWSPAESKKEGRPVLESREGEKLYGFSESDLAALNQLLPPSKEMTTASLKAQTLCQSICAKIEQQQKSPPQTE